MYSIYTSMMNIYIGRAMCIRLACICHLQNCIEQLEIDTGEKNMYNQQNTEQREVNIIYLCPAVRFNNKVLSSHGVRFNNKVLSRCIHQSWSSVQQQGSLQVNSLVPEFGATTRFFLSVFTSPGVWCNNKVLSRCIHQSRSSVQQPQALSRCIHYIQILVQRQGSLQVYSVVLPGVGFKNKVISR